MVAELGKEANTFTDSNTKHRSSRGCCLPRRLQLDMHRQSTASRSQFGQSSAQTATAQALRSKKKEYEAIAALEQSCAGLIATLEGITADLNTTAEATIGAICPLSLVTNAAEVV